ncbi:hypothetical protein FRB93_003140 [Tulasnella sp. JGI-2019a]|nr:hypothetical protein FRB93_003140 [Tulasnella sp. JGI-2019a]
MAHSGFHIGTFLLFVATVLLIISCISSPVTSSISLMKVSNGGSSVNFGTLGWCSGGCTNNRVGYDVAGEMAAVGVPAFSHGKARTLNGLTNALILHEVAAGIAGIAFILALLSHRIGFLLASTVASLAWVVTLVAMAIDFSLFGSIKTHVHDAHNGAGASFGVGTWTCLAAFIILFFATITTCLACITGRRDKSRRTTAY